MVDAARAKPGSYDASEPPMTTAEAYLQCQQRARQGDLQTPAKRAQAVERGVGRSPLAKGDERPIHLCSECKVLLCQAAILSYAFQVGSELLCHRITDQRRRLCFLNCLRGTHAPRVPNQRYLVCVIYTSFHTKNFKHKVRWCLALNGSSIAYQTSRRGTCVMHAPGRSEHRFGCVFQ